MNPIERLFLSILGVERTKMHKIVYIGHELIKNDNPTGITLGNLLCDSLSSTFQVIISNENITQNDLVHVIKNDFFPLHNIALKLRFRSHYINSNSNLQNNEFVSTKQSVWKKLVYLIKNLLSFVTRSINGEITASSLVDFQPEIIYTLGSSIKTHIVAAKISKYFHIPIIIHYMDDWRMLAKQTGLLNKMNTRILSLSIERMKCVKLYQYAINSYLAEYYTKQFKDNVGVIWNALNWLPREVKKKPSVSEKNSLTIVYIGGLHLGRNVVIENVISEIGTLRDLLKVDVRLSIYTNTRSKQQLISNILLPSYIEVKNYVDHNEMKNILVEADILLFVESFNSIYKDYTHLSLSTKIPEYLWSLRPILCVAPYNISSSRYVTDNEVGLVTDINGFCNSVISILAISADDSEQVALRSKSLYLTNHMTSQLNHTISRILD